MIRVSRLVLIKINFNTVMNEVNIQMAIQLSKALFSGLSFEWAYFRGSQNLEGTLRFKTSAGAVVGLANGTNLTFQKGSVNVNIKITLNTCLHVYMSIIISKV